MTWGFAKNNGGRNTSRCSAIKCSTSKENTIFNPFKKTPEILSKPNSLHLDIDPAALAEVVELIKEKDLAQQIVQEQFFRCEEPTLVLIMFKNGDLLNLHLREGRYIGNFIYRSADLSVMMILEEAEDGEDFIVLSPLELSFEIQSDDYETRLYPA